MRRVLSVGVVGCWMAMVALLVYRTWPARPGQPAPMPNTDAAARDEWMNVFHRGLKIGYTHYSLSAESEGFGFKEESLLRLTVLDTPQAVRTHVRGHAASDFSLREVEFELSSGAGSLRATGVVDAAGLRLTLHTGSEVSEQVLPVSGPLYLPSTLRGLLNPESLQAGRRLQVLAFDPITLKNDSMLVTVERWEPLPDGDGTQAWRLSEEFHGLKTTAWTDAAGRVLREEGPMELVLVRATAAEAVGTGWTGQTALDLVANVAVPVAGTIDDPRNRRSLRLHVSGVPAEKIPNDDEQTRRDAVVTITRPALAELQSYALPCTNPNLADDLKPTAFLQSDHPRVRSVARDVIGNEGDAMRAATRINDWVYSTLRKVPTVSIPNALQVLEMGEGDCNEHAVLFAALARAVGIPARMIAGAVYLDGAFLYHAWCEIWLGRWVSIDPALHQFPADATHLKLIAGGPDEELGMLDVIGRLRLEVVEQPVAERR